MQERLQKILAHAGIASRRKAEEMIEQGRVTVNGKVVAELGSRADAISDVIRVDGKRVRACRGCRDTRADRPDRRLGRRAYA